MTDAQLYMVIAAIPGVFAGIVSIVTAMRVKEVKEIVDGPLSVALKNNKELSERIADLTGNKEDIMVAAKAAIIHQNREEGKLAAPGLNPP